MSGMLSKIPVLITPEYAKFRTAKLEWKSIQLNKKKIALKN